MSSLSDIHIIWKDRGYPFELDWKEAFERKGYKVTSSTDEVDAGAYILLQGIMAGHDSPAKKLRWLSEKKGKKLALVINAHKLQRERRAFFLECGITAGMEFDDTDVYPSYLWTPAALNPHVYKETTPRSKRNFIGFRGNLYKRANTAREQRNSIMDAFQFPDVKPGDFIKGRENWANYLNSIKTIPAVEAAYRGNHYLVNRHFDSIGTKTLQIMYPNNNGIFDEECYIKLNKDHSNVEETLEIARDEDFCEKFTSRAREKILDTHTVDHRAQAIIDWINV